MPNQKLISHLCTALLLVAGFYGTAQAADPQGVRIRVTHRSTGALVGVGDLVVVNVEALPGVETLDYVEVGISADTTSASFGDVDGDGTADGSFVKSLTTETEMTSDGYVRFHFGFPIPVGSPGTTHPNLVVQVKVQKSGTIRLPNNQMTDYVITGVPTCACAVRPVAGLSESVRS